MQGSWSRASTVSVVGTVLAMLGLLLAAAAPALAGSSATCDYTASTHRVEVVVTGSGDSYVSENGTGQIHANGVWCDNTATVNNTDRIVILAGAGDQTVNLYWAGAGFKPGFTNEAGDSDEIEVSVSLGGGTDKLTVSAGNGNDTIRAGLSSACSLQEP
jgi:type II secretory pathway pseudopilin PulG